MIVASCPTIKVVRRSPKFTPWKKKNFIFLGPSFNKPARFVLLSRPPAVWSSTSLCVPASAAAHQRHICPRFRGPRAHVPAVSSTSAPTARRPSTTRPPAEWCSPDPTSPPLKPPPSYQAALAARGTSGAYNGALRSFYSLTVFKLSGSCFSWLIAAGSIQSSDSEEHFLTRSRLERLLYVLWHTLTEALVVMLLGQSTRKCPLKSCRLWATNTSDAKKR